MGGGARRGARHPRAERPHRFVLDLRQERAPPRARRAEARLGPAQRRRRGRRRGLRARVQDDGQALPAHRANLTGGGGHLRQDPAGGVRQIHRRTRAFRSHGGRAFPDKHRQRAARRRQSGHAQGPRRGGRRERRRQDRRGEGDVRSRRPPAEAGSQALRDDTRAEDGRKLRAEARRRHRRGAVRSPGTQSQPRLAPARCSRDPRAGRGADWNTACSLERVAFAPPQEHAPDSIRRAQGPHPFEGHRRGIPRRQARATPRAPRL